MPYLDVFVGDLESPDFKWEGGNWGGNSPSPLGLYFPNSRKAWYFLEGRFDEKFYKDAKQTDWGCDVARVTKAEIREFVHAFYGEKVEHPELFSDPDDQRRMKDLLDRIEELDDRKLYGLCARES